MTTTMLLDLTTVIVAGVNIVISLVGVINESGLGHMSLSQLEKAMTTVSTW
jgi:hypothetical protein